MDGEEREVDSDQRYYEVAETDFEAATKGACPLVKVLYRRERYAIRLAGDTHFVDRFVCGKNPLDRVEREFFLGVWLATVMMIRTPTPH